jgi:hypothetical protein
MFIDERGKTMHTFAKTLIASCSLVLASAALAEDNAQMRQQEYNDSVKTANENYAGTMSDCHGMSGADRRTCMTNAKTTLKQSLQEARDHRREKMREDRP